MRCELFSQSKLVYLRAEEYRREIHEGLNVVENWNSANGFVFFGKGGEIASNRVTDQEISAHALHLLQASLVYVNTRMIQSVLADSAWAETLSERDYRGLSPLIDASSEQIARARRNVPKATFIKADMCEISLEAASFDAVCAFYAISHIPRAEQGRLVGRIGRWLKPGGTFLASFGAGAPGDWSGEWLGIEMFFANKSRDETLKDIDRAGMDLLRSSIDSQDDEDAQFLWIMAARRDVR